MSIILSKTLQSYPVSGVNNFNVYELNRTKFIEGDGDFLQNLGPPISGVRIGAYLGNYAGTGIDHYIQQKSAGEYVAVLSFRPQIPKDSLRSFTLDVSFDNISGYNTNLSGNVSLSSSEYHLYNESQFVDAVFPSTPVYNFGGNLSKNLLSDPDFRTSLNLTSQVSGIVYSEIYHKDDYLYLAPTLLYHHQNLYYL